MRLLVCFVGVFFVSAYVVAHGVVDKNEIKNLAKKYEASVQECLQLSKRAKSAQASCQKTMKDMLGAKRYKKLHDDAEVRYLAASMLKQQSGQSGVAWAKACYGSSHPSIQKARLSYNRMLQEANKKKKNTDELAAHYQKSLTRAREIDANNRIVIPENVMLAAGDYEMEGDVPWYVRQRPFLVTNQWWALNVEREVLSRQFDNSPSVQANLELAKKKYEWDSRIRYQDNVCGAKSADPKVRAAYVEMRKFDICERYPQELRNCQMKIKEAHQEYKEAVAHYAKANPLEGGDASSATTEEAARNAQ